MSVPQPTAPPYSSDQPPSYEATSTTDAPPSYDSLFGEFRQVENPKGLVSFLGRTWKLITGTVYAMIALAFLNIIPIAMIIIGAVHIDDCPLEDMVPRWLIVGGAVHLVKSAIQFIVKLQKIEEPPKLVKSIDTLLSLFNVVWFVLGSIWVYSNFGKMKTTKDSPDYCDAFTMTFCFVFITVTYALLALTCCCFCCCCCCIAFNKSRNLHRTPGFWFGSTGKTILRVSS